MGKNTLVLILITAKPPIYRTKLHIYVVGLKKPNVCYCLSVATFLLPFPGVTQEAKAQNPTPTLGRRSWMHFDNLSGQCHEQLATPNSNGKYSFSTADSCTRIFFSNQHHVLVFSTSKKDNSRLASTPVQVGKVYFLRFKTEPFKSCWLATRHWPPTARSDLEPLGHEWHPKMESNLLRQSASLT